MRIVMRAMVVAALVLVPATVVLGQSDKPTASAAVAQAPVNLNTATVDQLETLPGVGRATAQRILDYRQKVGGFKKIEELMNVKGIGEKSFLKLKPLIVVQAKPEKSGGQQ